MKESDAIDAIEQILDTTPSVGDWEMEDVQESTNSFAVDCKISHSRAFTQRSFHNVNGFDSIEFEELFTPDDTDGINYFVLLKEERMK